MYPLHVPPSERPAHKAPAAGPTQPASPWQTDPRAEPARPVRARAKRRPVSAVIHMSAWPSLVMWTSLFYLVAEIA